jgi:hypothetical protein
MICNYYQVGKNRKKHQKVMNIGFYLRKLNTNTAGTSFDTGWAENEL